jgi:spore coat polysaccharide biosynthesis protein SpsF
MPSPGTGGEPDAVRLERLWAGGFGNEYLERNAGAGGGRDVFWKTFLTIHPAHRVLEVGCNAGANLQWIIQHVDPAETFGIDVNRLALSRLRQRLPSVSAVSGTARELPFRDRWFDLVFTAGVLIHQPDTTLPLVMAEVVRVSRRYVLCAEYFAPEKVEVPYRGATGALFKRDYGNLYRAFFPELELVDEGFLGPAEGWDDVTWWLFERVAASG